jgi:uncharacterized protein
MNLIKPILIVLGTISLGLGTLGIFIPGLPTTPFLLLTAGLYIRSSEKLYQKLISTRVIGKYIQEFQNRKGMTVRQKAASIIIMWIMIGCSCLFFIPGTVGRIITISLGLTGTLIMGIIIRTIDPPE